MRKRPEDGKQIHVISSGLKAGATWHRVEILQACRECCGGQGFLAANKIGPMKNDMDVDVTFEGDNTVMMQQVPPTLDPSCLLGGSASCGVPLMVRQVCSNSVNRAVALSIP